MTEERKEGEVAPEVGAAHRKLLLIIDDLHVAVGEERYRRIPLKALERWKDILDHNTEAAVIKTFRNEVVTDVESWLYRYDIAIREGRWLNAARQLRCALQCLLEYFELLGIEIPPEEEEEVAEEVTPTESVGESVEGTPLADLGLSLRVYNTLHRSGDLKKEVGIPQDDDGRFLRTLFVEEVLRVLEIRGEKFFFDWVKHFGKKSLEELKAALQEHGFLPTEKAEGE